MVHLILASNKGNQGLRYFPHTGYLGLTPLRVEGVVKTKLDADQKLLPAKSLTVSVRCYESRIGRVNTLQSKLLVDYTQVLWSKSPTIDFEPVGNLDYTFRINVPANVAGFSTTVFVDYRCVWRVEAVLTHIPISGVGSRQIKHFELPLTRYDLPAPMRHLPVADLSLTHQTNKPRAPRIRYSVNIPASPVGPLDLVSIPIHLLPVDRGVSIRSASVIVERRIQLHDGPTSTSASQPKLSPNLGNNLAPSLPPPTLLHPGLAEDALASTSSLVSSNPTITPNMLHSSTTSVLSENQPLLSPSITTNYTQNTSVSSSAPPPLKTIVNPIAGAESSGYFTQDAKGVWSKNLTLQWPAAKSHSRWAIGETIQSDLVSVRFYARVKIIVSSPSGTESIELDDQEILAVSTNEAERQLALSKYNDSQLLNDILPSTTRSKSKSPRRSRVGREESQHSKSLPHGSSSSRGDARSHAAQTSTAPPKSAPNSPRPHTSAGPRDKALGLFGTAYTYLHSQPDEKLEPNRHKKRRAGGTRPETSHSTTDTQNSKNGRREYFGGGGTKGNAPRIGNTTSGSSTSTTADSSSISSSSQAESESDQMREWEEELARIEMRSRRSSDLLGFAEKRKRSGGTPKVVLPGSEEEEEPV